MVNVTLEQAIIMFARTLRHRNGLSASQVARNEAERLKRSGDVEGFDVWFRVAIAIDDLNRPSQQTDFSKS